MSIQTSAIVPFNVTSIPERLTALYVCDKTLLTTTVGTGAVKKLNRIQSGSWGLDTPVIEVEEMGTQYRIGGIADLGEAKYQLQFNTVSINNLAAMTGKVILSGSGQTTSIGLTDFQSSTVDLIRQIADSKGNIFMTMYLQDCIVDDYSIDAKVNGVIMDSVSGRGPNCTVFPGYIIPKVYVATSTDVTNGYLSIASILGADEAIVPIYQPGSGAVPTYWEVNGAKYFLKIEKVPGASLSNATFRYAEFAATTFQSAAAISSTAYITPTAFEPGLATVGQVVTLGLGTANVENVAITAVAPQVSTNSGSGTVGAPGSATVTPASMTGIVVGASLQAVNANGSNSETVQVSAVTSTTFTATYASTKSAGFLITTLAPSFQGNVTKTHSSGDPISKQLTANSGQTGSATFLPASNRIYFGDTFANGDAFRLTICSYNTDSYATSIPNTTTDTTERAGVPTRLVPITINGAGFKRIQSASIKFSIKREHVQGVGENTIIYGVPAVPDIAIDFDVKESDSPLINLLTNGTTANTASGGTIVNDFIELSQMTNAQLNVALPFAIILNDPFNAAVTLCTFSSPQIVVKGTNISSSAKSDNTIKFTAMDIQGNLSVSFTHT